MPLVKKKWLPRNQISDIISKLVEEEDGIYYKDGPSRHMACAGLVVMANKEISPATARDSWIKYIYKFPQDVRMWGIAEQPSLGSPDNPTVSVPASCQGRDISMAVHSRTMMEVTSETEMDFHEALRLKGDLADHTVLGQSATCRGYCELRYKPETGMWQAKMLPPASCCEFLPSTVEPSSDKDPTVPAMHALLPSMSFLAEALTLAELETMLKSDSSEKASFAWKKKNDKGTIQKSVKPPKKAKSM